MKAPYFVKALNLQPLLDNFTVLDREFKFSVEDYELESTDGEYYFIDVDVRVTTEYNEDDDSFEVVDKMIEVVFHHEYFTCDKDGGELEEELDSVIAYEAGLEIEKEISDCL